MKNILYERGLIAEKREGKKESLYISENISFKLPVMAIYMLLYFLVPTTVSL